MHDLELPNPPMVDLLYPIELPLHEVASLDGADEGGPTSGLGSGEIGGSEHARQPIRGNEERVHEVQPALGEVVKLPRARIAILLDRAGGGHAADHGPIRGVAEAYRR